MDASLHDLTAFVQVARRRSFRAAADALGVSRSSLSHALRGLEERLDVRLLNRTTRSVALTDAGARLLDRLEPTLLDLRDMLAEAGSDGADPAGPLRISAMAAGSRWLLRHVVPDFLARHPRVELEIVTDARFVDITAEGFDAGVRLREAVPQDMVAVPFGGDVRFLAVASPDYVARAGRPETPHDLRRHRCIRQRLASGRQYRWEFARGLDEIAVDVPGALTLDDNALMVEAAAGGLGIAFVPEPAASPALEKGELLPLLEDWSPHVPGLCLYYSGLRHTPPSLRAFVGSLRREDSALRGA